MSKFFVLLASTALLVATSCGKGGLGRSGVINSNGAQKFGTEFLTLIGQMRPGHAPTLPTNGTPTGVTPSAMQTRALASCITQNPDPATDNDGDGIAAQKTYTYDCKNEVDGTRSWSYKGTTKVQDLDDTKKWMLGGYRYDFNSVSTYEESGGAKGTYGYQGYWLGTSSGASMTFKSDYTMPIKASNLSYLKGEVDYSLRAVWEMTITGDDPTTPWTKGRYSGKGSYIMDGKFDLEDAHGTHSLTDGTATLEFRAVDLVYDNTCAKFYKSGSWIFLDGGGNTFEIRYDCTTLKAYLNGTVVTGVN